MSQRFIAGCTGCSGRDALIKAEHTLHVDAAIDAVWVYVSDIHRWSALFPGCTDCAVLDDQHSNWTVKVGAGGLIKTVRVMVEVVEWVAPSTVGFTFRLNDEPVTGHGAFNATACDGAATEIRLSLVVEGSGQMAPMWEAMCRPLLPSMASTFAGRLQAAIEGEQTTAPMPRPSRVRRLLNWLRVLIMGSSSSSRVSDVKQ